MIEVQQLERKRLPKELLALLADYSIADIIASLVPNPIQASSRQLGPMGNVFFRPMVFEGIGSQNAYQGHAHHYDHVTFLSRGMINIRAWEVNPRTGKPLKYIQGKKLVKDMRDPSIEALIEIDTFEPIEVIERQYQAPSAILIKRNWAHEFIALEEGTRCDCIFAIRDFNGEVVQEWNGNMDAVE